MPPRFGSSSCRRTDPGGADRRSIDPEAYNLYLLANRFHYTFKQEDVQRSVPLYEKAVALEPDLAPAWAMLGMAYWWLGGPPASAIAAVEKAVGVDPGSGTAYAARGVVRGWTWDVSGSNADHERSLALSPKDPWVIGQYCVHELRMGRYASAVATCRQASDLDPLSAAYWNYITFAHLGAGELSAAKAANARALVLSPDSTVAKYHQCRIAFFSGELSRAVDLCARLPEEIDGLAFTALARSQLGDADEAARALRALVAKAGPTNPGVVARVYAGLGHTDVAFEWLDRAYALESTHMALVFPRHSLSAIKVEPLFRKLHGDARYIALLEKMKLPVD